MLKSAAIIHCLSDWERDQVAQLGIETPTFIIPNGIFLDLPDTIANTDSSRFLARYPGLVGKKVILFMGRLHVQKGLEVLASSFSRITARFHDAVLLIAGPDDARDNSKEKMIVKLKTAGIQDRVIFTGPLTWI